MTQETESLLEDLSSALLNREFETARTLLTELEAEYEPQQGGRSQQLARSRALVDRGEPRDVTEEIQLDNLWLENSTTRITRSLLLVITNTILEAHEKLEEEGELAATVATAQATVEYLRSAESQLAETKSSTASIVDGAEIPPAIGVSSIEVSDLALSLEEQTSADIAIENVGAGAATDVTVAVTSSSGLEVEPEQISIGSIGSGQTVNETVQIGAVRSGNQTVEFRTVSENAGTDRSMTSLTVRDTGTTGTDDAEAEQRDGIALSPELIAGLGIGSIGVLYLASRMLSDDDDDQPPMPPNQR